MHPAHYKGRPQQSRSNGVYLCSIISLAFCLIVTFRYWKTEVSVLLAEKEQLQNEWQKKLSTAQKKEADIEEKVADLQKKIDSTAADFYQLEDKKHDVDSKLEKCENEKMEDTAKKDKEIESLKLKLKATLQKVDDLIEKQEQANAEKEAASTKTSPVSHRDDSKSSEKGEIAGHEEEDKEDEESLIASRRNSYPTRSKRSGTRTAGTRTGSVKTARIENVIDPFQLSAPDERDARKGDKAGEEEEEEEDEEEEEEGDNAGKIVFSRGGVDTTKSYKEDEETQMRNSRTGNREGIQEATLSDAVQTEATT